ncbi:MAG: TorF family putative porin [Pseudomonadota bacterium]|nr:TorF family putative porin [Pseudomonadota bacterium]
MTCLLPGLMNARSLPLRAFAVSAAALTLCVSRPLTAAETWGGSLATASDYYVRGISRSHHEPALQAELHLATDGGFIGGLFASSVQFNARDNRGAELSGFVGFAWTMSDAWRARALASYYGYPGNIAGTRYDYAELSAETSYDDWLNLNMVYSPDAPRYVYGRGLTGVTATSVEATALSPWRNRFAASGGVGYSRLGGVGGERYLYWSAGAMMDLAPLTISAAYVSTTAEASALYDGAAAHNRWTASLIWRF